MAEEASDQKDPLCPCGSQKETNNQLSHEFRQSGLLNLIGYHAGCWKSGEPKNDSVLPEGTRNMGFG